MTTSAFADPSSSVAVVGMAGRFPGAASIAEFWRNLRDGVESISFFSDDELREAGIPTALLEHPSFVGARGALADVDRFDADFFGFTPREAEVMDPQLRLFLEAAWTAMEDAGYDPATSGEGVGVFAGSSFSHYFLQNLFHNREALEAMGMLQANLLNGMGFVSTWVSYKLNLRGPSINVQTACSTSLVAVHTAAQSLLAGECRMALAGGVSVAVPHVSGYLYQPEGILSPDGHCRAFDAQGKGTIDGSGVGVVALKRLDDALADGDRIHAVIRGSAINNDGSTKIGFTAPSVDGQAEVIAEAQAIAGVDPASISYVEAHGSGTPLGDPIEIAALTQAFGAGRPGTCAVGAVKTNVGHLDSAAGIAGFIKTVLALRNREIPPTLHFQRPNPEIDFASSPFYVPTETKPWTSENGPRRAGVSSFGMGGTNAHVVLEEAPPVAPSPAAREAQLLVVSARTPTALATAAENLAAHLEAEDVPLADAAYTLQVGRRAFAHRRALLCRDRAEAVAALRSGAVVAEGVAPATPRAVGFALPGTGFGSAEMVALHRAEPAFREALDRALAPLAARGAIPAATVEALAADAGAPHAIVAAEYALGAAWTAWGVAPEWIAGRGAGELAAAALAGVYPLETALALALSGTSAPRPAGEAPSVTLRKLDDVAPAEAALVLALGAGVEGAVAGFPAAGDPRPAAGQAAAALGTLWAHGAEVRWAGYHAGERRLRVPLPTYPFERGRFWLTPPAGARSVTAARAAAVQPAQATAEEGIAPAPVPAAPEPVPSAHSALHPRPALPTEYVAPRTVREEALAGIWRILFGIAEVGVHDSFFELGGHSLLATQMISRVREGMKIELPLRFVFEAQTIAELVPILDALEADAGSDDGPIAAAAGSEEELLARLDGMSEEEMNRLLAELSQEMSA